MGEFRRIKRELAYQGTIMKIYKDYVEVNGKQAVWDFFHHNGGAAVIPVTKEGKILMVRQYRNAIDRFTLEIPAGAFDTTSVSICSSFSNINFKQADINSPFVIKNLSSSGVDNT